jgi:HAD superfamily hydrolase (TIGR01509 family)
MIRALIFDFDGLIIESELPGYLAWKELYTEYGADLPRDLWVTLIGTHFEHEGFNPFHYLVRQTGLPLDRAEVEAEAQQREMALIRQQPVLPGVLDMITAAQQRDLKLAVASSSKRAWVEGHLDRLDLRWYFPVVKTREDVGRAKPAPDLFEAALGELGAGPTEAIVLEDSAPGIAAARAAGIFAVAVPSEMTQQSDFSQANLVLRSLADLSLEQLLEKAADGRHTRSGAIDE